MAPRQNQWGPGGAIQSGPLAVPDLVPLTPEWRRAAWDLYQRRTARLPHCIPALPDEFSRAMEAAPRHAKNPVRLAAVQDGRFLGFASGVVNEALPPRLAGPGDGSLLFLLAEDLPAADRLVSVMVRELRNRGASKIVAFDAGERHNQLPFFNGAFPSCPESLAYSLQALTRAGFAVASRELNLTLSLQAGMDNIGLSEVAPSSIRFEWSGEEPLELELQAVDDTRKIGVCEAHVLSLRQDHPVAANVGYIRWLGVDPEYQRRGIGRILLTMTLHRMIEMGLRRVFLTTGSQNWRAQPLYLSLGFQVVGTSISLVNDASGW